MCENVNTTVLKNDHGVREDIRPRLFKVTVVQQLWHKSENAWKKEDKSSHRGGTSPLATGVDAAKSSSCYSMLPPSGQAGAFALSTSASAKAHNDRVRRDPSWPIALCPRQVTGAPDQNQPKQQWFLHSQSIVSSHTRILHLSWKSNSGWAHWTKPLPEASQSQLCPYGRPDSMVTALVHPEEDHDLYLSHLLSDRLCMTLVSISSKPIRHCLGVILLKEYIDILLQLWWSMKVN